uniref:6-hydroxymethylpterin diphosphokinase MptE-like domain-containing protein n=1 Tax=Desulfovibrio sp. U5L TaxID=596152 RepID=I2Q7N5_9BACT
MAVLDLQQRLKALKDSGFLVIGGESRPAGPEPAGLRDARHRFFDHAPLWGHVAPGCARPLGPDQEPPMYERLPAEVSLAKALARTRLCLFAGAAMTPELRLALARPDMPVLVFEPQPRRLSAFLETVSDAELAAGRVFLFGGDTERFEHPLSHYLNPNLFALGYPTVFALPRLAARHAPWLASLARDVETLFFRHRIYPVEGQSLSRSLPLRPLAQGLFYDQTRHAYENTPLFFTSGRIDEVKNTFRGTTAVCVAAGPALDAQIPAVRRARERGCLLIAVNNAARTLAANGLAPHFVVINDTSLEAGRAFTGLPALDETVLVLHPLAAAGAGVFSRRLYFSDYMPQLFGPRQGLRLHGSVITTAVSLARHLGCVESVLAGVQLASPHPLGLAYAKNSIHARDLPSSPPKTGVWPELYPMRAASGREMYTTANYLDARRWFLDEVRTQGLRVVNLTADSLLFGPGVTVDPDFTPSPGVEADPLFAALRIEPPQRDRGPVLSWLAGEGAVWEAVAKRAADWLEGKGPAPERLATAEALVRHFDANGVSYCGQRYRDFDNRAFHERFFGATAPETRLRGGSMYFESLRDMALELLELVRRAHAGVAGGGEDRPLPAP